MFFKKMCNDIYLDNAATTRFKPQSVITAAMNELKYSSNPGRSGHCQSLKSAMMLESARQEVRNLTFDQNVIFTKNCTEALNLAIYSVKPKGEVITSVFEHNSVLRPLRLLEQRNNIKIKYVRPASNVIKADEVLKHINTETKLIVLSEMSNVTGAVHEISKIGEIAAMKGIKFIIDTAQSMGHTTTDYNNVDIVCSSGHKGLHGPQGTGFLAAKEGIKLIPMILGGTGTMGTSLEQPEMLPESLESGTVNSLGIAGLAEGIKWTIKNKQKINKKIEYLSLLLIEGLHSINTVSLYTDNSNGVISFNVKDRDSTEIADILDQKYHIAVRSGIHCAPLAHRHLGTLKQGTVRASIGYINTHKDIEKIIAAVREISK